MSFPISRIALLLLASILTASATNHQVPPVAPKGGSCGCGGNGTAGSCDSKGSLDFYFNCGQMFYPRQYDLQDWSRAGSGVSFTTFSPKSYDTILDMLVKEQTPNARFQLMVGFEVPKITAALADPVCLYYPGAAKDLVKTATSLSGKSYLRQANTDDLLTDIQEVSGGGGWTLKAWSKYNLPALTQSGGLWVTPSSLPTVEIRFRNPDHPADNHRLAITKIERDGTTAAHTTTTLYTETSSPEQQIAEEFEGEQATGNVLRRTTLTYSNRGSKAWDYTLDRVVEEAVNQSGTAASGSTIVVVQRDQEVYQDFSVVAAGGTPGAKKLVQKTIGVGSSQPLVSTYSYSNTPAVLSTHARLLAETGPGGAWKQYAYNDSEGSPVSVITEWSAWKDVAPENREQARKVVTTVEKTKTTKVTTIAGQQVEKEVIEITTEDEGATLVSTSHFDASDTLLSATKTRSYSDAHSNALLRGRPQWTEREDGTLETYAYESTANGIKVLHRTGAKSATGETVISGTEVEEVWNVMNLPIHHIERDIASGLELNRWNGENFDTRGRAQKKIYNGEPDDFSEALYACCGVAHERNRDASTADYVRDELKRVTRIDSKRGATSPSITTIHKYNGLQRVTTKSDGTTTLLVSDVTDSLNGTDSTQASPDVNGDGQPEVTTQATSYTATASTTTVTYPDGGTRIASSYRDGQTKSITGSAVADVFFDYGAHNQQGGGIWTKTLKSAANSSEWIQSFADAIKRPIRAEYPDGAAETRAYYAAAAAPGSRGKLQSATDADGVTISYTYEADGHVAQITEPMPGNQQRITVKSHDVINDTDLGTAIRETTTVNGVLVSTSLRSGDGYASKSVSLGATTKSFRTVANANGDFTQTTINPDGTKQVTSFAGGLAVSHSSLNTENLTLKTTSSTYDTFGRTISSTNRTGTTTYALGSAGQVLSQTAPGNRTTTFTRDAMGRKVAVDSPDTQDAQGNALSNITYTSYYPTGQIKAQWGAQNYPVLYQYDEQNRMTGLRTYRNLSLSSLNTAVLNLETQAGFDPTSWIYHPQRGWLVSKRDAANLGNDYTYTPAGKLASRLWARSVNNTRLATSYTHEAGKLISIDYADSTPDVTYAFDAFGRQTLVSNGIAKSEFTYDPATLRLDKETISYNLDNQPGFEFVRVLDRAQDAIGRDTGFTLGAPLGAPNFSSAPEHQASYAYSPTDGRLASVSGGGFQPPSLFTYTYLPNSNLIASATGPAHTVVNTWFPDRDALQKKENKAGETVVSSFDYGVNAIGQRTGVATSGTAFAGSPSWAWGYDSLGQVIKADNSANDTFDRAYQFDSIGNRKKSADSLTLPADDNYTANALNQYSSINDQQSTINPLFDSDGNMTSGPVQPEGTTTPQLCLFQWDAENRLTSTTVNGVTTSYLYDPQSRRIAKVFTINNQPSTINYLYDQWNCIAEYSFSSLNTENCQLKTAYTWGLDLSGSLQGAGGVGGLLSESTQITSNPLTYNHFFPTFDGNGNVSEYLGGNGAVAARFEYDAFGNTVVNSDTTGQFSYRFSTKPLDATNGLYYYGHRYYNPLIGRWISRDPIEEDGGINLNCGLRNSFVNEIDYLGLCPPCDDCEGNLKKSYNDANKQFRDDAAHIKKSQKKVNDGWGEWEQDYNNISDDYFGSGSAMSTAFSYAAMSMKGAGELGTFIGTHLAYSEARTRRNNTLSAADHDYYNCKRNRIQQIIQKKCTMKGVGQ